MIKVPPEPRTSLLDTIARWFRPNDFSPRHYWESRHQTFSGSLAAVGHAQISESANREQYLVKAERVREALMRSFPNPRNCTLLDAGCGIGALTRMYVEMGFQVTGVDFSPTAVAAAMATGIDARFEVGSLESLNLGCVFDAACIVDVLQHLVDDESCTRAIASLARHIKLDGLVLVVDSMAKPGVSAVHCRRRTLSWHEAEFRIAGLEMIQREQFPLMHENSVKHLLTFQKRH